MKRFVGLSVTLLLIASCGGGGGGGTNFNGLTSGTAANEITSVKIEGSVSESATVTADNGDLLTTVSDDDAVITDYSVTIDLDGVELPVDPRSTDIDWELILDSDVSAKILSWYFRIEAEE